MTHVRTSVFRFLFILLAVTCMTSCAIQKRHYRDGYYIHINHAKNNRQHLIDRQDTTSVAGLSEASQNESEETVTETPYTAVALVSGDQSAQEVIRIPQQEKELKQEELIPLKPLKDKPVKTEQPGAEKDKPNLTVLLMILGAMLLVGLIILIVVPFLSMGVFVLGVTAPFAGVLLYIAALLVRKKKLHKNMAGATDKKYRTSKWYHKFSLPLHLFFGSVILSGLGFLMTYAFGFALNGFLSVLGVLIIGAGLTSIVILSIVLAVLSLLYLLKWRKSGEQRVDPYEKKRKDG